MTIGALVCCGWIFSFPTLQRLHPALASMKVNTAFAVVLLGAALLLSVEPGTPSRTTMSRVLATFATAIALASLLEYCLGIDLGIDELMRSDPGAAAAPGRMSPMTGGCLLVLGICILWLDARWTEWFALSAALFALLALLGYLYGVRDLYSIGAYSSVALHTALALSALSVGALLARPERAVMRLVASDLAGGVLARRLVPAAIFVPSILALLRQCGEQAGLYGTGFGRAMLVASNIVVFLGLILRTASELSCSDQRRRAAETAVRESEADLAITLESIGDAVISTDRQGRVARMNPAAERLTGWASGEARGRPLAEVFRILNEDTGETVESPVDLVLRNGVVVGLANHTILVAKDGEARAIADSGAPIRDASGATRGVVLVFHDQSDARASERRLRESEARKAAILESALDAVVSVDASGLISEFNPAAEAMFGCARAGVIGRPLTEMLTPPGSGGVQPEFVRDLSGEEVAVIGKRIELTAYRRDGQAFPAELSITRVALGGPPAYTGFIRDVSEAKHARTALLRSRDRLRTLADASQAFAAVATSSQAVLDRIAEVTADLVGDGSQVTLLSDDGQSLRNVANAHRDASLAQDYKSFLSGVTVSATTSTAIAAIVARTGESMRRDVAPDEILARSEEALRPIVKRLNVHSFAAVPIRARGTVIGTLSLARSRPGCGYTDEDVTLLQDLADRSGLAIDNARLYAELEQRVAERTAELRAANEELEAFSYSVAHDLRAPLRAIAGFGQILSEDHAGQLDADGMGYLRRICGAARRMGGLIDDLLMLAHVERMAVRKERVDLSELAHAVVDRLRVAAPERSVEVVVEDGLVTDADPRLLDIVLTNLLGNAWKFTSRRERARIEFSAKAGGPSVTYMIRDNGAGFDAAQASKLFGVFQRLHTTHEFEGTGLGLAIVRRIIHHHGGSVWAEGELDRGATLYFTLEGAVPSPAVAG